MKNLLLISGFSLLLFFTSGCKKPAIQKTNYNKVWNKDYIDSVDFDIVRSTTDFAIRLFKHAPENNNIFLSPLSISYALAMTYNGAENETKQQMASVLGFSFDKEQVNAGFQSISGDFNSYNEYFIVSLANSIWAQKNYSFLPSFIENCKKYYQSGYHEADFISQTDLSRKEVNKWVSAKTNEKINDLLSENDVTTDTRMILVNALYFKSGWLNSFEESLTSERDFFLESGDKVNVKMMLENSENYLLYKNDSLQLISIPYKGHIYTMNILLPQKRFSLKEITKKLTFDYLTYLEKSMTYDAVNVYLPKFGYTYFTDLSEQLASMGMKDAFSENADFSGMTGKKDLILSKVIHKTFIDVNEAGTEAAAATAVVMLERSSVFENRIDFIADHPFIYYIKNNENGTILFIGRLSDPNKH